MLMKISGSQGKKKKLSCETTKQANCQAEEPILEEIQPTLEVKKGKMKKEKS